MAGDALDISGPFSLIPNDQRLTQNTPALGR